MSDDDNLLRKKYLYLLTRRNGKKNHLNHCQRRPEKLIIKTTLCSL